MQQIQSLTQDIMISKTTEDFHVAIVGRVGLAQDGEALLTSMQGPALVGWLWL
jgi:hypothetical protein